METLYEDAFIETRMGILENSFEVILKKEVESTDTFREILVEIEQEVSDYNFRNIIFVLDRIKCYPDEKLIRSGFLPDLSRLGVKKLAVVAGEDKTVETFHREFVNSLKTIEKNLGMKIVVFPDIASAMNWVKNKFFLHGINS
jgi:hypothetical protein